MREMPTPARDDDAARVLTTAEAARLLTVHPATLRRLHQLHHLDAPPRLQISPKRVGYRLADLLEWQRKRLSPAPTVRRRRAPAEAIATT